MNTLRSTERNLFRIVHSELLRSARKRSTASSSDTYAKRRKRNAFSSATNGPSRFNNFESGLIRLHPSTQPIASRCLSTVCFKDVPLLNPDKLEANLGALEPIVPITHPNFTKSKTNTIPSVTKILQTTMPASSRYLLEKWKQSMIKKLGAAGFQKYQTETMGRGTALHVLLAHYLLGKGEPNENNPKLSKEVVSNLWNSIKNIVQDKISNVRLVEHVVTHHQLNYRGIVDCVAVYQNELVVIDFKTAEKPKKNVESLYDNPLQVTAYCGALNSDPSIPKSVIDRNICSGLIITAYTDGSEASVFYFGRDEIMNNYWSQWIVRLEQYSSWEQATIGSGTR